MRIDYLCKSTEKEGFIYTVAGKGCFVARQNAEMVREEHLRNIEEHLREIRKLAADCGLRREDVMDIYRVLEEEDRQ